MKITKTRKTIKKMRTEDKRGIKITNRPFPTQITQDAKRYLIINDIAQGMTYMDIVNKYEQEWGLGLKSVQNIVNDTINFMRSDEAKESLIAANMMRLENIITDSMDDGDRKNAIKAIDTQNKLAGGYTEKVKIEGDSEINLNFEL